MKRHPAMASPFGRALEQGSRSDLFGTEACGGDKILLEARQIVSVFIGIYGGGIRSRRCLWALHGRGARPTPRVRHLSMWAPRGSSRSLPKLPVFLVAQKNRVKSATYFDLRRY